jgi:transcriptional regulator with XRE-family HTH domain
MKAQERTGAAIRKLRLAKGLTLAELAGETGIPLSTLSRVELGQNALKYDKLMRICRALEVDLEGLVAREAESPSIATGRRAVSRKGEGGAARLGPHAALVSAAELTGRSLTPLLVDVAATSLEAHGPPFVLEGEAWLTVLSGEVVLHGPFYAPLALSAGDAVYFDGRAGHALVAAGAVPAKALLVVAGDWAAAP